MRDAAHIGTSGWHYRHWVGPFYPPKTPPSRMFEFYAQRFDTVELNNTFYRLPSEKAVIEWRESAPPGFCFAVKGSRFLTHMKKLADPEPGIERFFERADLLKEKLGPIVFQLPPHWTLNFDRLRVFLDALPRQRRYAFEFRNPTWNDPSVYRLLRSRNVAYCIYHLSGLQSPLEITADFTYIRLHGPDGPYQGSYDDRTLRQWAKRIRDWNLKAAYVYFDNDQAGYAPQNAFRIKQLLIG
jgi:uncharacterized protein YecE (DUF72 family)